MTESSVHQFDLPLLKEPEDLWNRFFFAWLKNLSEQNSMNLDRLSALDGAITELDNAISRLLPEKPDDLLAAMSALREIQEVWKQQSSRSLDNVEEIVAIAQQIAESQKTE